jgi:hypothetical protein
VRERPGTCPHPDKGQACPCFAQEKRRLLHTLLIIGKRLGLL